MSQEKIYPVAKVAMNNSHLNRESYEKLYKKSIEQNFLLCGISYAFSDDYHNGEFQKPFPLRV